jgi:hypothetical protein
VGNALSIRPQSWASQVDCESTPRSSVSLERLTAISIHKQTSSGPRPARVYYQSRPKRGPSNKPVGVGPVILVCGRQLHPALRCLHYWLLDSLTIMFSTHQLSCSLGSYALCIFQQWHLSHLHGDWMTNSCKSRHVTNLSQADENI